MFYMECIKVRCVSYSENLGNKIKRFKGTNIKHVLFDNIGQKICQVYPKSNLGSYEDYYCFRGKIMPGLCSLHLLNIVNAGKL